jgi:hypothetical protein
MRHGGNRNELGRRGPVGSQKPCKPEMLYSYAEIFTASLPAVALIIFLIAFVFGWVPQLSFR